MVRSYGYQPSVGSKPVSPMEAKNGTVQSKDCLAEQAHVQDIQGKNVAKPAKATQAKRIRKPANPEVRKRNEVSAHAVAALVNLAHKGEAIPLDIELRLRDDREERKRLISRASAALAHFDLSTLSLQDREDVAQRLIDFDTRLDQPSDETA